MRPAVALIVLILCSSALADEFRSDFTRQPDRRWAGPDWCANRLQDWRVADRWLECVEARKKYPVRTCALLTREIDPSGGGFTLRAEVRGSAFLPLEEDDWAGFLFGIGGPEIDPRLRALVQGMPAEDGGILAVVDGTGRVAFRDFTQRPDKVGYWSVDGALPEDACRIRAPRGRSEGPEEPLDPSEPILLELLVEIEPDGTAKATLRALRGDLEEELSRAVLTGLSLDSVDGSISLASHGGTGDAGHAFRSVHLSGGGVRAFPERAFGPVLGVLYTVSDDVLKLTAQLPPLGEEDPTGAALQILGAAEEWTTIAVAERAPLSDTCTFRVDPYVPATDTPFRVVVTLATSGEKTIEHGYEGTIRAEPAPTDPVTLALISCTKSYTGDLRWNENGVWFPHAAVADAILASQPDLFLSVGDQIYEGDLSGAVLLPEESMILDYHTKWHRWLWSFGAITRVTPTVTIPDDHDVYHGNIWGAGNERAPITEGLSIQDSGGYKLPAHLVSAIHRTQVSHLPDPVDPEPIAGGISVYHTRLEYAGLSLAILGDRMWKSSPSYLLPEGGVRNGWARNPEFDWIEDGDPEGAELLGERQEEFLTDWAVDWTRDAWLKVAVSQSVFANLATLPPPANSDAAVPALPIPEPGDEPTDEIPVADADSNGWPRTARNRAVGLLRLGSALHLTGDQHLASVLRYGIDEAGDAGVVFGGPAVANTWPRRWFPRTPGENRDKGDPRWLGDHIDGFGNPIRVIAVANPVRTGREPARLHDRVPGFGLVRLDPTTQEIVLECWPRGEDPLDPEAAQYPGWPVVLSAGTLDGRPPWGHLPAVTSPVEAPTPLAVRVREEPGGAFISCRRLAPGETWIPPVFAPGNYTVEVGDGTTAWEVRKGQTPIPVPRD